MSECKHCLKEKQERKINGSTISLCLDVDCLIDRLLVKYEGCSHDFETVDDGWFKCKDCGMNASLSYLKYR